MAIFLGFKKQNDIGNYLPKSSGTMSGDIDLDGNDITGIANIPSTNSSIIIKKYLTDNYITSFSGDMFGNLNMNRNIVFNLANNSSLGSAVNREYVHATFLQTSGGIMKGDIDLN